MLLDNKCMIVHNNYIKGADSKIYREKEMLFYKVDINHYYSNINVYYFTFLYFNSSSISEIEKLIWIGLSFTNYTNYIFVLPKILCIYCKIYNNKWCSYIYCWRIRNLNKCFAGKYRENV